MLRNGEMEIGKRGVLGTYTSKVFATAIITDFNMEYFYFVI